MRVIAGDYKGRKLETPMDNSVRPTSDKVKEALFSILMNDIWGSKVCDLFAGTGGLGIEALSRGAEKCYFADQSRASIKLLTENVKKCGAQEKSVIIPGDFTRALERLREQIDIFIIDPPYGNGMEYKAMEIIQRNNLLAEDGVIVVEHDARDKMDDQVAGFTKLKEKKYGKVVLSIYVC